MSQVEERQFFDYEVVMMFDGWNLEGPKNYPHSICERCHISWSARAKYLLKCKNHPIILTYQQVNRNVKEKQ